jgi:UPF0489 domain
VQQSYNAPFSPRTAPASLTRARRPQWIVPLLFEGHVSAVWWLRPPWSDQFADGAYDMGVGRVAATGGRPPMPALLSAHSLTRGGSVCEACRPDARQALCDVSTIEHQWRCACAAPYLRAQRHM